MSDAEERNQASQQVGESVGRPNSLPIPKPFDGNPESWQKWRQRFTRYRTCAALDTQPQKFQVSTFLYAMGDIADDILTTLGKDENSVTYQELLKAFDEHFKVRKNTIIARARFNRRNQKTGEQIDNFIQDLYRLADDCEYGPLREELIRDRIVAGVSDDTLSDELQAKASLTLEEAVKMARQFEARQENKSMLRGSQEVHAVQHKPQVKSKFRPSPTGSHSDKQHCSYCGQESHARDTCPARQAICRHCSKKGHYAAVCRSRPSHKKQQQVREVASEEDNEDEYEFLGSIDAISDTNYWSAEISMNGRPVKFKLDTGASVSVIGRGQTTGIKLKPSAKALKGPGNTPLQVLGTFEANLTHKNTATTEIIYVIAGQHTPLLSRQACVDLNLVQRVEAIQDGPDFFKEFPTLFSGLGKTDMAQKIRVKDGTTPTAITTPRRVAQPLLPKVKQELDMMLEQGVISPVTQPTEWCFGMVPVLKPNGNVRICVDLTPLNKSVRREMHPMSTVDESLSKLAGSRIFSKLDAKSAFWQIPLSEDSKLLTTFITPFGRYCFNRLPYGICSASEIFQRTMMKILDGVEGVICHMDDVLIHGPNAETHNVRVRQTLQKIQAAGITLNEKCEFSQRSIRFLGCIIDDKGVHVDPNKVAAVRNFPPPTNVTELQRFMGMVNHNAKFLPDLAKINGPLRQLLCKDRQWVWEAPQQEAFQQVKDLLSSSPVLAHYSPERETIVAADASKTGLGAVLIQVQEDKSRRPVSFISRSLTEAEMNYAVIEKEALAATWATERFNDYLLGLDFVIETDHKPLVPLLNTTEIAKMPPRIQRFKLRLMRYNPTVIHVAGKNQITADALSRAPASTPNIDDAEMIEDINAAASQTLQILPATSEKLQEIREKQNADAETAQVIDYCQNGWPSYMPQSSLNQQFWTNREHFSVVEGLLLYDDRLVIPRDLQLDTLHKLHESHLGITKCRALAQVSVWWPYISQQIEDMIKQCQTCSKLRSEVREPLMPSSVPERPWERVAMDLFELKGKPYIVVVDYLSRWAEVRQLQAETASATIVAIKSIFATHGIPDVVVSDNGPNFSSGEFVSFAKNYGFTHITSSPRYPQSNGEAERNVQTVKKLLKKAEDPYMALLMYRATPLHNGLSPAEILMGRKLRTKLPIQPSTLQPQAPDLHTLQQKEKTYKEKQRDNYNAKHAVKDKPPLQPGDPVYVRDMNRQGQIIQRHHSPRSYLVQTDQGTLRRNSKHLVPTPGASPVTPRSRRALPSPLLDIPQSAPPVPVEPPAPTQATPAATASPSPTTYTTRSGRQIKQPTKLNL